MSGMASGVEPIFTNRSCHTSSPRRNSELRWVKNTHTSRLVMCFPSLLLYIRIPDPGLCRLSSVSERQVTQRLGCGGLLFLPRPQRDREIRHRCAGRSREQLHPPHDRVPQREGRHLACHQRQGWRVRGSRLVMALLLPLSEADCGYSTNHHEQNEGGLAFALCSQQF